MPLFCSRIYLCCEQRVDEIYCEEENVKTNRRILGGQVLRIYIKDKHNFEFFLLLMFAIIFLIFSIVISAIYGTEGLMTIIVLLIICCFGIIAVMLIILAIYGIVILIKNTFGIKCDRSEWKDKSGKKKKK